MQYLTYHDQHVPRKHKAEEISRLKGNIVFNTPMFLQKNILKIEPVKRRVHSYVAKLKFNFHSVHIRVA